VTKRIAKKIVRSLRGPECQRYSVDQVRRALLRVYQSPLQLTDRNAHWRNRAATWPGLSLRSRVMVITDKLAILEQRGPQFDAVKRDGRIYFESRTI
jgi:hypothetical protein